MMAIEVILILVGVVFLLGSFMMKDKLTEKDMNQIAKLSDEEIKRILDKKLRQAENKIEDSIDEKLDEKINMLEVSSDKMTNEKIMAISEYSDTVLDSMNKSHNEIMFLYSMLNDKHQQLTELASQLSNFSNEMKNAESAALQKVSQAAEKVEIVEKQKANVSQEEFLRYAIDNQKDMMKDTEESNHNDNILFLHASGKSDVDIAKELGLGLGEVKLVIGLFNEEQS